MNGKIAAALAIAALYFLATKKADAAPGAGPVNARLTSTEPLTSPQDAAPSGYMWEFDYAGGGAWRAVPIP